MPPKLTCLIPCRNEEQNIGPCIHSLLGIADEILIADSLSTDRTLDVAREAAGSLGRIVQREYRWSGDFKNWAIPQAEHEWVLLVDADERVTPELAAEILQLLSDGPRHDGYWIYRENYFLGHPVRHAGLQTDCCLRLFRRDLSRYVGENDHAEVQVSTGKVADLKNRFLHYTTWSWDHYLAKLKRYSSYQAEVWYKQGRKPSFLHMVVRPAWRFFRDYFIKLGFLDGSVGFQFVALQTYYVFMKQARLWELHHGQQQMSTPQPAPQLPVVEDIPELEPQRRKAPSKVRSRTANVA